MTNINSDRHQSFAAAGRRRASRQVSGAADPRHWKRSVAAVAVASCFAAGVALANPVGPTVVSGQASFSQRGNALTVNNSTNAVIHWQSFSIGPAELTRFIQPSASSAVLNRVTGGVSSDILGALQSNGRVFLINPSGIVFGAGARIDVAGLVASTLNITNEDFLSGRLRFAGRPEAGSVVNQGAIRTAPRGNVYLIAPNVENSGVITSPRGEIILAAGRSVELVDAGTPDLRVQITAPDNAAVNLGSMIAQSGRIGIYAGLINQKGLVNADTAVVGENGRIVFKAKDISLAPGSVTTASGAPGAVRDGGEVRIVADGTLDLQQGAAVHVDGGADGGNGGFLELSGKQHLALDGNYTVRAFKPGYRGGTLLFDPINVEFCDGGACVTNADLQVAPGDINTAGASLVEFLADNDITVTSPISAADLRGAGGTGAGTELTLTAGNDAAINASVLFDPNQSLIVEAGRDIVTGNNATVQAGRVTFDAVNGGITIGAGTAVVASNPGAAFVGMLAGTVTGSDFASTSANTVDILGSVRAESQNSSLVAIGGAEVTVADSGRVEAVTSGAPTASQAAVVMSAMASATGGFGQPGFQLPSVIDAGVQNSVLISGRVAATDPNLASVRVLGGTVNVNRGTQLAAGVPNIEAAGGLRGDVLIAAVTRASNLGPVGIPGNTLSATDRALNVSGWIRGTAGANGTADVEVLGGAVTLRGGSRLDAVGGFANIEATAASATSEAIGSTGIVNTATFVPGNRVQVDAGAALDAQGSQVAEVDLMGGSVNVAGDVHAVGNVGAAITVVAASRFIETLPITPQPGPNPGGLVQLTHGTGHDATVSGVLQAGAATGNAQVTLAGDRVSVTGGTQASPNVVVSGSSPFGGVLAVAASTSSFNGPSSLIASTHNDTTNVVDVSGWIVGNAADMTVDVVGGKVNVTGGLAANGTTAGAITVAAVTSFTADSLGTVATTHAPGSVVRVSGELVSAGQGDARVSVLGGALDVAGTVRADGPGTARVQALAATSASLVAAGRSLTLLGFTAGPGNLAAVHGTLSAGHLGSLAGEVDVLGGQVNFSGLAQATGDAASILTAAASGPCDGASCPSVPGMEVSLGGTVTATGAGFAQVNVSGDSINQTGGGALKAVGNNGALVNLVTATGDLRVGGLVSADGGSGGEGIVNLSTGPSSGNIIVTGSASIEAIDAFGGTGCPPVCALVSASALAGTISIDGSVLASSTGSGSGGAAVSLLGDLGVTLNGTVTADSTASFARVVVAAPEGVISVGPGVQRIKAAGVGPANISLTGGPSISILGGVDASATGPSGTAGIFLSAQDVSVLAGGEVEAVAPAGGLIQGVANRDITIGGNIYGGVAGGGVTLIAGNRIIGAGGTLDGNPGDTINLTAANGIGAVGAPVRILDGEARVSALNSTSGDIVITQVNGDLVFGPVSGGSFTAVSNAGGGGIDLSAAARNLLVQGPLAGNNSFIRLGAAGGIAVAGLVQNLVGDVFLQGAGAVTVQPAGNVIAGRDLGIVAGSFTVGSDLVPGSAGVFASRDLVATVSGPISVIGNGGIASLGAGSNIGLTTSGDLSVRAGPGATAVVSANVLTGTILGNTLVQAQGTGALAQMSAITDIGTPTLPLTIFGTLSVEGLDGGVARMQTASADSINLFFPLLGSGGFFVNGVEGQVSSGNTGLFVNGLPAVLASNLNISYGGGAPIPDGIRDIRDVAEAVDEVESPLTGYVNEATEFEVPSGEQRGQQTAPGGDDGKKKKRPQMCS